MRLSTAPSIVAGTSRVSRSPTTAAPSSTRTRPPSRMVCTSCSQKNGCPATRSSTKPVSSARQRVDPELLLDERADLGRAERLEARGPRSTPGRAAACTARAGRSSAAWSRRPGPAAPMHDLQQQRPRVRVQPVRVLDHHSAGAATVVWRRIEASSSLVFSARTLPSIAAVSSLSGMPTGTMLLSSGRIRRSSDRTARRARAGRPSSRA